MKSSSECKTMSFFKKVWNRIKLTLAITKGMKSNVTIWNNKSTKKNQNKKRLKLQFED